MEKQDTVENKLKSTPIDDDKYKELMEGYRQKGEWENLSLCITYLENNDLIGDTSPYSTKKKISIALVKVYYSILINVLSRSTDIEKLNDLCMRAHLYTYGKLTTVTSYDLLKTMYKNYTKLSEITNEKMKT